MVFSRSRGTAAGHKGFTLVEVMVAMLIVALALPALLGLVESLSQHTYVARSKTQAYWVAQNRLAELMIEQRLNGTMPSRKDSDTVELGRQEWRWTVTSEETPLMANVYRVEVRVGLAGQEGDLAWVSGFMLNE